MGEGAGEEALDLHPAPWSAAESTTSQRARAIGIGIGIDCIECCLPVLLVFAEAGEHGGGGGGRGSGSAARPAASC